VHVIATAGHVDHGKSTLVRALTGTDPDRLEEEHRRGLSIRLGYCWTTLPEIGDLAFVDVPGHERFIATTLSGIGPASAVLFVVAADDGWMPQAAEHLAALDGLGVRHGVLAVTRSDLADPAPMLGRARAELAATSLGDVPAVAVSARTGHGLDELRRALVGVVRGADRPPPDSDVRLWVDRSFHVRGAGTVVTGTLPAGTVRAGDTLLVDGAPVRVRGVESLGRPHTEVTGPARVALNLAGRLPDGLGPGSVLVAADRWRLTDVVDVRLHGDGRPPQRPLLHVGATSTSAHLRALAGDLVRLVLARPLPLRFGDVALLRDPGSRALWGVRVLDPAPPSLRRRGAAALREKELRAADGTLGSEVARRGLVRGSLLRRIGIDPEATADVVRAGDWLLSAERAAELRAAAARLVAGRTDALQPGVPAAAVAHALGLPDAGLLAALVEPPLRLHDGRLLVGDEADRLPAGLEAALHALRADLADAPFAAPDAVRLAALGLDRRGLARLAAAGWLLRLDDQVVLLPGADRTAVEVLRGLPQPFTTSAARAALGTTRRVALPLLAHLDRSGATRRLPDDRRTTD
jgi:selenocysteine-specific elongation factor